MSSEPESIIANRPSAAGAADCRYGCGNPGPFDVRRRFLTEAIHPVFLMMRFLQNRVIF
jgi:hypothetical protein